jgi:hypothetical protein
VISVKFYSVVVVKIVGCEFLSDTITICFGDIDTVTVCKFSLFGLFGDTILFVKTDSVPLVRCFY